jgi:hypothetical protein
MSYRTDTDTAGTSSDCSVKDHPGPRWVRYPPGSGTNAHPRCRRAIPVSFWNTAAEIKTNIEMDVYVAAALGELDPAVAKAGVHHACSVSP